MSFAWTLNRIIVIFVKYPSDEHVWKPSYFIVLVTNITWVSFCKISFNQRWYYYYLLIRHDEWQVYHSFIDIDTEKVAHRFCTMTENSVWVRTLSTSVTWFYRIIQRLGNVNRIILRWYVCSCYKRFISNLNRLVSNHRIHTFH